MLDIIVPHYKEAWEIGEKLFRMIALQRGINFRDICVTIVNDGGHRFPEGTLAGFPYEIRQIDIPHSGVSAARNAGIECARYGWLMFCDFDDTFANVYALRDVMTILPADNYDMLWSRLIVEDFTDGKNQIYFSPNAQRFVFTHGKVYRKAFLDENDIRFDETMDFQEDSLFNATIIAKTSHKRIGEIKTVSPMFVWIRRPSSVTNSGREDEALLAHFIRNLKVTEENRERGYDHYCGMVTRTAWDAYYMIMSTRAGPETKRRIMEVFTPWIAERIGEYGKVEDGMMDKIREISRGELYDRPIPDGPDDVLRWLYNILKRGGLNGNINNEPGTD